MVPSSTAIIAAHAVKSLLTEAMRAVFVVSPWVNVSPRRLMTATAEKSTGQVSRRENEESDWVIV